MAYHTKFLTSLGELKTPIQVAFDLIQTAPVVVVDLYQTPPAAKNVRTFYADRIDDAVALMRAKASLTTLVNADKDYGQWSFESDGYLSSIETLFTTKFMVNVPRWVAGIFAAQAGEQLLLIVHPESHVWFIGATDDIGALAEWDNVDEPPVILNPKPARRTRLPFE